MPATASSVRRDPDLFHSNVIAMSAELERLRRDPKAFARLLAWLACYPDAEDPAATDSPSR